jgi:hypothetical protein
MSYGNDRRDPTQNEALDLDGFGAEVAAADDDDAAFDDLLDQLRAIGESIDPTPSLVTDLAYAAFETRDLDAELAALTADSALDTAHLVRGAAVASPRMISFEAESVTVELQVERGDDAAQLRGFVVGATGVTLETATDRRPVQLDEHGWFLIEDVPFGALRLRLKRPDGRSVSTEWIAV